MSVDPGGNGLAMSMSMSYIHVHIYVLTCVYHMHAHIHIHKKATSPEPAMTQPQTFQRSDCTHPQIPGGAGVGGQVRAPNANWLVLLMG